MAERPKGAASSNHSAGLRLALTTWLAAVLVAAGPITIHGQATGGPSSLAVPVASAGASVLVGDVWEDQTAAAGFALRAGVRHGMGDLSATLELWPEINDFRIATILLEATFPFDREGSVSPFLLLGMGHAWISYQGDNPRPNNLDGTAASLGLGLEWFTGHLFDVRTEAVLRADEDGQSAAVRLLLGWKPQTPKAAPRFDGSAEVIAYWMVPLSGPWRFVEPAYGFRLSRDRGPLGGSVTFSVLHWQIPGEAFLRDYIWDTRAFVAQPALLWHPPKLGDLTVRGGPSITQMSEGPGDGVSLGGHLEFTWAPGWARPFELGGGWLWMRHDTSDPRYTADDQHGLTLFGGLHF